MCSKAQLVSFVALKLETWNLKNTSFSLISESHSLYFPHMASWLLGTPPEPLSSHTATVHIQNICYKTNDKKIVFPTNTRNS